MLTIYHNPRCSKSRATLALIEDAGVTPEIALYLDEPPSAARIIEMAGMIGVPVRDLTRRGEADFKAATDLPDLDDDVALANWLSANPRVIERPIVVDPENGRAVIGRPPENVMELLK